MCSHHLLTAHPPHTLFCCAPPRTPSLTVCPSVRGSVKGTTQRGSRPPFHTFNQAITFQVHRQPATVSWDLCASSCAVSCCQEDLQRRNHCEWGCKSTSKSDGDARRGAHLLGRKQLPPQLTRRSHLQTERREPGQKGGTISQRQYCRGIAAEDDACIRQVVCGRKARWLPTGCTGVQPGLQTDQACRQLLHALLSLARHRNQARPCLQRLLPPLAPGHVAGG